MDVRACECVNVIIQATGFFDTSTLLAEYNALHKMKQNAINCTSSKDASTCYYCLSVCLSALNMGKY